MIGSGHTRVFFCAATWNYSNNYDQEYIIYRGSIYQDSTNVLNSNEKIPVPIVRDRDLFHNILISRSRLIPEQPIPSFPELL